MNDDEYDFRKAARRVLFDPALHKVQDIPGAGRSAAEAPEKYVRVKVTMNLDGDVVAYFKERAAEEGRAYQSLINQVLREYVQGSRPERLARETARLLLEDETFLEALEQKLKGRE